MSAATTPTSSPDRSRRGPRPPSPWRRRIAWLAVALVVAGLASAAPILSRWSAGDATAEVVTGVDRIEMVDSRFTPPAISVPVGTEVTFAWTDGDDHDVRFDDGTLAETRSSGTWSRTFDAPGTYPFRCTLHAFMDGRVEVG